jgi:hypothetical protein
MKQFSSSNQEGAEHEAPIFMEKEKTNGKE